VDDYKKRSFRRLNKNCKKTNCPASLQFSSSRIVALASLEGTELINALRPALRGLFSLKTW
jgi:hypothetical protein